MNMSSRIVSSIFDCFYCQKKSQSKFGQVNEDIIDSSEASQRKTNRNELAFGFSSLQKRNLEYGKFDNQDIFIKILKILGPLEVVRLVSTCYTFSKNAFSPFFRPTFTINLRGIGFEPNVGPEYLVVKATSIEELNNFIENTNNANLLKNIVSIRLSKVAGFTKTVQKCFNQIAQKCPNLYFLSCDEIYQDFKLSQLENLVSFDCSINMYVKLTLENLPNLTTIRCNQFYQDTELTLVGLNSLRLFKIKLGRAIKIFLTLSKANAMVLLSDPYAHSLVQEDRILFTCNDGQFFES